MYSNILFFLRYMKKKAFTLIEVIISITIFFIILVVVISLYTKMIRLKYNIQARQSLIQNSYDAMEKANLLLKDYTIDYEEYFNRRNVWCSTGNGWPSFTRVVGTWWYCSNFSAYGNANHDTASHWLYYCSSANPGDPNVVWNSQVQQWSGCAQTGKQSFGEYFRQFQDVRNDVDYVPWALWDEDDVSIFAGPEAILDATKVQELYLISQDGKQRLLLRRALVESGDWNKDGIITGDSDYLYTLQILKLRWFDAGDQHDFDSTTSSGVYNGRIDTRACDYAQGFICNGSGISDVLYSGYKLPLDSTDGWVNLFDQDLTVADWNLIIYPTESPVYALTQNEVQINPYFTLSLTNKLYGKIWYKKLWISSLDDFQLTLQTTLSTKNFYTK